MEIVESAAAGNPIEQALAASQARAGELVIEVLRNVELASGPDAPLDHLFLKAERAYHLGIYPTAVPAFGAFERDPRSRTAPPWQLYLSAHRQCWMAVYQGDLPVAVRWLREGRRRIAMAPELEHFVADLEAIEGHLFHASGEYELARGRFLRAHEDALRHQHWILATSTSLDIADELGQTGRLLDARPWVERSWETLPPPDRLEAGRDITLRAARLKLAMREYDEAQAMLDDLIRENPADRNPSTLIQSLIARADMARVRRRPEEAERDLSEAIKFCDRMGLRMTRAQILLELAALYLARHASGDLERGQDAFGRALRQALALSMVPSGLVRDLAEDLFEHRGLLRREMPATFWGQLDQALNLLWERTRPRLLRQAARQEDREAARVRITKMLETFWAQEIRLAHVTVYPGAEEAVTEDETKSIGQAEIEVLRLLLKAPKPGLTRKELEAELGLGHEAVKKRLRRLKTAIGEDLISPPPGGPYVYAVKRPVLV
jgi:tetratricopeptide (TPR) repeat protein